jgi:diguanylate cyclase (GGDEF)-like protein/PAS domain S-box-containing protein
MLRRRSLHTRLALRMGSAATLIALVAGFGLFHWSRSQSLQASHDALQALAAAVERTAAVGAYTNDPVLLQEVADGVAQNNLVAAVRLSTPTLHVVGRHAKGASPPAISELNALERPLNSPFDPTERVGSLRLIPDATALEDAANRQAYALVLVLVGLTGVVALLVNFAAERLIAKPIIRLAAELGRMDPGTDQRMVMPPGHAHDEIGGLVASTNRLLHSNQAALERERALRVEIQAMEAQYRHIFDTSSAGIFVLDGGGCLLNANPTLLRMLSRAGTTEHQAREGHFFDRVFANPARARALVADAARSRQAVTGDFELRSVDGSIHWVHCLFSVQAVAADEPQAAPLVEGVLYDVTERRHAEQAAQHAASHDTLTGLLNRAACAATVASWRPGPEALHEEPYTVLFIDLDGFKAVNDLHGHTAGDEALRQAARRLLSCTRGTTDLVSRNGGDEFVVVLRGLGPGEPVVSRVAEQIRLQLRQPMALEGGVSVNIGVSIGMACFPQHGESFDAVLTAADAAMYGVKHTGKDSFAMAVLERAG